MSPTGQIEAGTAAKIQTVRRIPDTDIEMAPETGVWPLPRAPTTLILSTQYATKYSVATPVTTVWPATLVTFRPYRIDGCQNGVFGPVVSGRT